MLKNFNKFIAGIAIGTMLVFSAGCTQKQVEEPKTEEQQRNEALANAEKNAKLQNLLEQQRSNALANVSTFASIYFANNPRFDSSWKIVPHTDDYISPSCPQGSGWAWASIMKVENKEVQKNRIYCSTSSASVGCYIEADFAKSPYASQSTKCDPNLPYPIKRVGG